MNKWVRITIVLIVVMTSLYLFRLPLSIWFMTKVIDDESVQISCLDWSFAGWSRLSIDTLCLDASGIKIRVEQATLDKSDFVAERINVKLDSSSTQSNQSKPTVTIPVLFQRPKVVIDKLTLQTPWLEQIITLSVSEPRLNHFEISGDIEAQVALQSTEVSAMVSLASPVVKVFLPTQIQTLSGVLAVQFDGETVTTQGTVHTVAKQSLKGLSCQAQLDFDGEVTASYQLATQAGLLTLIEPIALQLAPNCLQATPIKNELTWQLMAPQPIEFSPSQLTTDAVRLSSSNTDLIAEHVELDLTLRKLNTTFSLAHQSQHFGQHSAKIKAELASKAIAIQGEINSQVDSFLVNEVMELAQVNIDSEFVVRGNPQQTLNVTLQPQLKIGSAMQQDIIAEQLELKAELTSVLDMPSVLRGHQRVAGIPEGVSVSGPVRASIEQLKIQQLQGQWLTLEADLSLQPDGNFIITSDLRSEKLSHDLAAIEKITQQISWAGDLSAGEFLSTLSGNTSIAKLVTPKMIVKDLKVISKASQNRTIKSSHVINASGVKVLLEHQYSEQSQPITVRIPMQSIDVIKPLVKQWLPELQLSDGSLSATIAGDLVSGLYQFNGMMENVTVLYQDRLLRNVILPLQGQLSSANIQLFPTKMTIQEIRSGAVLNNFSAELYSDESNFALREIEAQVFGGKVSVENILLSEQPQTVTVNLERLSLDDIAKAGRDVGVELRGRISGNLPVHLDGKTVRIKQGKIENHGEGVLRVENNASINALKEQQPSLQNVIGVLDDLTVESLVSDVSLSPDGWLDLGVRITGVNKAQKQPVNFNYTHSENVFDLLRALRLSDEITREVEKALNQEEQQ
ncbi:YdbH domain-containing protein [Pseudoalteromonas sp. T1lg65]|uniref:YdbH domain-containing protein n=1 Tax=Pseudoalteromonas sp. T1lg65 TaxID=2077101 RepID=UPI003F7AB8BA